MTGPGFNEMDMALYKDTPLWKDLKLNFAAQIFNVYNQINLGMPNTKGVINGGQGTPRNFSCKQKSCSRFSGAGFWLAPAVRSLRAALLLPRVSRLRLIPATPAGTPLFHEEIPIMPASQLRHRRNS
jgi:hypothetical protein